MKPGMRNSSEFSVISIAAILAVSPTTVTLAACLRGIVLSIGIIVKAYPIAKASPTASTSIEIISQPSIKPIAASDTITNVATNQAPESMLCSLPSQAAAAAAATIMRMIYILIFMISSHLTIRK